MEIKLVLISPTFAKFISNSKYFSNTTFFKSVRRKKQEIAFDEKAFTPINDLETLYSLSSFGRWFQLQPQTEFISITPFLVSLFNLEDNVILIVEILSDRIECLSILRL